MYQNTFPLFFFRYIGEGSVAFNDTVYRRSAQPMYLYFFRYIGEAAKMSAKRAGEHSGAAARRRGSSLCDPPPAGEGANPNPAGGVAGGRKIERFRFVSHQNWSEMRLRNWPCSANKTERKVKENVCCFIFYLAFPCRNTKWKPALASTDTATYSLFNAQRTI